jgi:WD40 repeat protein
VADPAPSHHILTTTDGPSTSLNLNQSTYPETSVPAIPTSHIFELTTGPQEELHTVTAASAGFDTYNPVIEDTGEKKRRRSSSGSSTSGQRQLGDKTEANQYNKRQRTEPVTMRRDDKSKGVMSNGYSISSNGSTPKKSITSMNGHSPAINGSSPSISNGTKGRISTRSPYYRNHNREELTRILIQGLNDMGYTTAANTLCKESGYELESNSVAVFRNAILEGDWPMAESILLGVNTDASPHVSEGSTEQESGLILAEGANKEQMLFHMRQQKFLELLDQRELGQALMVLRQELAPLNHDIHQLHTLSSLLMCPAEDLRAQAHWPETLEESRNQLLQDLTKCIAPSVMIRDHRLAELLDQVKEAQINRCLYHNTSVPPSLYADHMCNRENFPSRTWMQLDGHEGEVWHVQFSNDGTKLATASQDKTVLIYSTTNFEILHKLERHEKEVTFVAWSPDDMKIISCSKDGKARVWDVASGRLMRDVEHNANDNSHAITSATWGPDSEQFATSSHDSKSPICLWTLYGQQPQQPIHTWTSTETKNQLRSPECRITPDGRRLLAIDTKCILHVYDLHTYREEYKVLFSSQPTSLTVSADSKTLLVNLAECEIHMFDLDEANTIRKFKGQKQGTFVIRSCFGGAAENFVLSGSEGVSLSFVIVRTWLISL